MNDQKLENLLNLSLDATPEELEKSFNLGVGFDKENKTWEIIVRYYGDIMRLEAVYPELTVIPLLSGYAIMHVRQEDIDRLSLEPEIEFIEQPKRLFFAVAAGRAASCITSLQSAAYDLFGQEVLVAVIDSGIDYRHPDFIEDNGQTRIDVLWDQTIPGNPPEGYRAGSVYTAAEINAALAEKTESTSGSSVPSMDFTGHGTAVAGICAGNGRASGGRYRGVASQSRLVIVKLSSPAPDGFPRTTQMMQAIDFAVRYAIRVNKPMAINISYGNNYGAHDGTSLLETYIDSVMGIWKTVIVIGAGNEGTASGHYAAVLQENHNHNVQLSISGYERDVSVQIWKSYSDEIQVEIISPGGLSSGTIKSVLGPQRFKLGETEILLYYGMPSPYRKIQEIYIEFLPVQEYLTEGQWIIRLVPEKIVQGDVEMWMPAAVVLNKSTGFLRSSPTLTLTIPSTADKVITVGAYNTYLRQYADFSGRGYTGAFGIVKPDIVAPGVDITTTSPGGGYSSYTGTSFAAPFVTGSAALMMQWGIIEKRDLFLYGEKVKAYLIKGARQLPGLETPNAMTGWGALCVRDSLPD